MDFVGALGETYQFGNLLNHLTFDLIDCLQSGVEVGLVLLYLHHQVVLLVGELADLLSTEGHEATVQIVAKVLEHRLYVRAQHVYFVDFLFDRARSQTQDLWAATLWVGIVELVEEEVAHNQVVEVVLVCVVALVENNNRNFIHLNKTVHEQIVELLGHCHENVVFLKLLAPSLQLRVILAAFLFPMVTTHDKVSVAFDYDCLLLNQVLHWHDEEHFLACL
jgi:hypothetical protein